MLFHMGCYLGTLKSGENGSTLFSEQGKNLGSSHHCTKAGFLASNKCITALF